MTTQLERIEYELKRAGYTLEPIKDKFETDDDYVQSIGTSAWEVCKLFCNQGHSGLSAEYTIALITKLLKGDILTPLTNDPEEWEDVTEFNESPLWQSKRKFSCFSNDNLQTYYDSEDPENRDWELDENGEKTGWSSIKPIDQLKRVTLKSKDEIQQNRE